YDIGYFCESGKHKLDGSRRVLSEALSFYGCLSKSLGELRDERSDSDSYLVTYAREHVVKYAHGTVGHLNLRGVYHGEAQPEPVDLPRLLAYGLSALAKQFRHLDVANAEGTQQVCCLRRAEPHLLNAVCYSGYSLINVEAHQMLGRQTELVEHALHAPLASNSFS